MPGWQDPLPKEGAAQQHSPQEPPSAPVEESPPGAGSGQGRGPLPKGSVCTSRSSAVALGQGGERVPSEGGPLSRSRPGAPHGACSHQPVMPAGPRQDHSPGPRWLRLQVRLSTSASCSTYLFPKGQRREVPTPPTHPAPAESGQPGTGPGSPVPGGKF